MDRLRVINRDGVDGHYCIARSSGKVATEYWDSQREEWLSFGTVYSLNSAVLVIQEMVEAEQQAEIERLQHLLRDVAAELEHEAKDAREAGFVGNAMHWEREAKRLRDKLSRPGGGEVEE